MFYEVQFLKSLLLAQQLHGLALGYSFGR